MAMRSLLVQKRKMIRIVEKTGQWLELLFS